MRAGFALATLAATVAFAEPALAAGELPAIEYRDSGAPSLERQHLRSAPVERLADVVPALAACWQPPPGLRGFERLEVTARFSLRRDGSMIGDPRVTYATADIAPKARELLTRSVEDAMSACTPLRMSPGLGGAIAGRVIAVRFIYRGPKGPGA